MVPSSYAITAAGDADRHGDIVTFTLQLTVKPLAG
jgi:hypothetical protein